MPKCPSNVLATLNGTNGFVFTGTEVSTSDFITLTSKIATGDLNGDGITDVAIGYVNANTNGVNPFYSESSYICAQATQSVVSTKVEDDDIEDTEKSFANFMANPPGKL